MSSLALSDLRAQRDRAAPTLVREAQSPSRGVPIALQGVSKSFAARHVLRPLDLEFPARQFVAIVGRSGCGKTTLLRLIAGLDAPSAGTISIGATRVSGLQKSVRLLFQDPRLLPWQSVMSNVGLARAGDWRRDALGALRAVGLAERADEWPGVLSGGQKQRVALARALVSRPQVLLLDEPFGSLDALTRLEMQDLLANVWRQHGFNAILITHDVAEAVALADRVIVLRDGGIALDLDIDLPRPCRSVGEAATAQLQAAILDHV
jgi:sulfonate transport system ATP-binding protein